MDQIDLSNVDQLQVAWEYHSGDASPEGQSQIQANPIVVDGVLFGTSPGLHVFAIDAATGREIWQFDPFVGRSPQSQVNRGVSYWSEGTDRRIYFTAGNRLYALNAHTGQPVDDFGSGGWVDLREGLGRAPSELQVSATSPGVIFQDVLIQGTRVPEGETGSPGHLRAFDVRTGAIRWMFRTIPAPGEFGHEEWAANAQHRNGGANAWAGLSLDTERGIVFVPTGSMSFDFFGGNRPGTNLFGNSVIALDALTGNRIWHYQVVHHDIWDYDLPAAPTLVSVRRNGKVVSGLAQITKMGFVFVLDRMTGQPLFPVEERPVPPSKLEGEQAWPTQPIPLLPKPFARQSFTEADVTDISPEAHEYVLSQLRQVGPGQLFTPLGPDQMIVSPGMNGGGEWGGAAWDPETGVLYVNGNELPYITRMIRKDEGSAGAATLGAATYVRNCASCHGSDRRGDGDRIPSLVGVEARLSREQVGSVVQNGRGLMPSFRQLNDAERQAVVAYILNLPEADLARSSARADTAQAMASEQTSADGESPYRFGGYQRFYDSEGYPAIKPPWGTLNAIDLHSGETLWRVPLGEYPELTARGIPPTGTTNYGGPVVTAGGLVFIAATADAKIRAFDKRTGTLAWEATLPTSGYATPSTYMVEGRQYVVIAAGGGKLGSKSGDSYVAFALPR